MTYLARFIDGPFDGESQVFKNYVGGSIMLMTSYKSQYWYKKIEGCNSESGAYKYVPGYRQNYKTASFPKNAEGVW